MSARYRILRRLGQGAMAEVFLAELDIGGARPEVVAIKRPLPHLVAEPEVLKIFIDEARLCARLSHPGIAQLILVGEQDGEPFLAMEYVDGVPLRQLLAEGPLPVGCAVFVGAALAAALAYAHGREGDPVIHRDVTPNNLLVTRGGDVKLIDFGVARAKGRLRKTATGALVGTPGYLAPEQLAGEGEVLGPPLDVFALGVVLHACVAGVLPFKDKSPRRQLQRMLSGEAGPLPSSTPPALAALIARMLSPSSADRPTAAVVEGELRALVAADGRAGLAARVAAHLPDQGGFDDGTVTAVRPFDD
jgi:serine/threonine protein kinase